MRQWLSLYALGVTPHMALNSSEKYALEEKPSESAISRTLRVVDVSMD